MFQQLRIRTMVAPARVFNTGIEFSIGSAFTVATDPDEMWALDKANGRASNANGLTDLNLYVVDNVLCALFGALVGRIGEDGEGSIKVTITTHDD
ncbi:MAG: hypothetical protein WBV71_11670 [Roseobacter sp.]